MAADIALENREKPMWMDTESSYDHGDTIIMGTQQ